MMKNKKLFYAILVVMGLIIGGYSLILLKTPTPTKSNFNLIFKYGVMAKNILNTFERTYTKDMIMDPSITIKFSLSKNELNKIYQKMVEINFFDYPDTFSVSIPPGESVVIGMVTPHNSYYFKVEYNSKIKELWWVDKISQVSKNNIIYKDEKAEKLRELIKLILNIIVSKEEYKKLPSPRGGYI